MRIRGRPPSHLVMQRGTYESSCSAAETAGGWRQLQPPRAICYFALSATRSLIKRPPRRSSSAFFKSRGNIRHAATGGRAVLHSFFPPSPLLTLLLPRDPLSPCVPRTKASRRRIRERRDFVKATPRASRRFASLREICLATTRNSNTVLQGNVLQYWISSRFERCYALRRYIEKVSS